ncbi:MAG: efflux RND transporter periplasmic adaptor subunit [Magnetococcales bacterium]|nr:efflux RND transporter periplasmic adaptor subunit [Magnetococcales bacterium]MBF0149230.1 efflux RND transporter periplasmic adaptor subunit [Magnetococcales bacterium]MBF0171996.1 efflux RND transporter periplasmic adaptor subunit [Magnetococcales bacterium]MBF0630579.1 efflux RND transporter periplasmic adaptor subunit [Magnetococcales bacterium]
MCYEELRSGSGMLRRSLLFVAILGYLLSGAKSLAVEHTGVKVSVIALQKLLTHPSEEAQAQVVSLNDVSLSTEVSGIIDRMEVEVGDSVGKGALLMAIDDWSHRFQVEQEAAGLEVLNGQLRLAQLQLERVQTLQTSNQASRERLDSAETEVKVLKGRIAQQKGRVAELQARLARTQVQAPFAGMVVERFGHMGGWIAPGSPVLRLLDIEHVELSARVAGESLGRLKDATHLRFHHHERVYEVKLKTVIPLESPVTGTQEVRLLFTGERPVPGAAGRLWWEDSRPHLPAWVLVKRDGVMGIFVARDQKAEFLALPQASEGSRTPWISEDRSLQVVVEGRQALKGGELLTVTEATGVSP